MDKFWRWVGNEAGPDPGTGVSPDPGPRTLYLEGPIAQTSWFEDEVTPAVFKAELLSGSGPITVWINSPGGDVVAAAQIYNMLMEYPGDVTVKVDGIAASAASVIAMAGTNVLMSPVSTMMIHNPLTVAMGDTGEMRKAIQLLDEVKESIINAYEIKTGLSRARLSHMMDSETWMNARKALELGFCDGILHSELLASEPGPDQAVAFSRRAVTNSLLDKLRVMIPPAEAITPRAEEAMVPPVAIVPPTTADSETPHVPNEQPAPRVKASDLMIRLALLK